MTIIAQMIADRLILKPSRHELSAVGKDRHEIPFRKGNIEAWTQRVGTSTSDDVDLFVLKFAGTAGRAERATYHPMDYWTDLKAELWAINPPGYGGSTGSASVKTLADMATTAFDTMDKIADGRPIIVMGNSLGTVPALYLSANRNVAGMVLRNPPPLRQLIVGQYGWWNLWIGAMHIAQKVPREICSIRNASQTYAPAVFISSGKDEVVPSIYQEKVISAYEGHNRVLFLKNAKHSTSLSLNHKREYRKHLAWLREQIIPARKSAELVGAV